MTYPDLEAAQRVLRDVAQKRLSIWAEEILEAPLDASGDETRRTLATNCHVLKTLLVDLELIKRKMERDNDQY